MADEWVKMRRELQTDPRVVRIASACNADKFRAIGGLHAVWCVFDLHTENGRLDGYTFDTMDQMIGWPGFSAAMASVGWLAEEDNCLIAVNFEEHNGRTAKRRAKEAVRKKSARNADKKEPANGTRGRRRDNSLSGALAAVPDDWQPSPETIAYAGIHSLPHSDLVVQKFKDHFRETGKLTADPDASYRKWLANERKPGGNGNGTNRKSRFEASGERLDEFERAALAELHAGNAG